MITQNQRLTGILLAIVLLLFIPFIAMQLTDEVSWSLFDFMIAGGLLLTTGLLCELVIRKIRKTGQRILICLVVLAGLLLIWAELAVGIFGTPISGQ